MCIEQLLVFIQDVACQFIGVGNSLRTGQRLVAYDVLILNIRENIVHNRVGIDDVIAPDIVSYRIVLTCTIVFLEHVCVLVGKNEVGGCAVFYRLKHCVLKVTLHIERTSRKLDRTVENDADEGYGLGREIVARGIECHVQNMVNIFPRVGVSSVGHDLAVILIKVSKRILRELL